MNNNYLAYSYFLERKPIRELSNKGLLLEQQEPILIFFLKKKKDI